MKLKRRHKLEFFIWLALGSFCLIMATGLGYAEGTVEVNYFLGSVGILIVSVFGIRRYL